MLFASNVWLSVVVNNIVDKRILVSIASACRYGVGQTTLNFVVYCVCFNFLFMLSLPQITTYGTILELGGNKTDSCRSPFYMAGLPKMSIIIL